MSKITPFLWFEGNAGDALSLYKSVFPGFQTISESFYPENAPLPAGAPMSTEVEIFGTNLVIFNCSPYQKFNPAVSLSVWHSDKEVLKKLWEELASEILMPLQSYDFGELYGWCNDKFGVSWQFFYAENEKPQVIPSIMFTGSSKGITEEALNFYSSKLPFSKILATYKYGENSMGLDANAIMHSEIEMLGQKFIFSDGGPAHKFKLNESISFVLSCDNQEEVDKYWDIFTKDGGEESQCAWCKDKFGVSWQIVPKELVELLGNSNPEVSGYAMQSMMGMKKIIIKDLYK